MGTPGQQSQLVIRGLVGGRHQLVAGVGYIGQFGWLHLHLGEFRRSWSQYDSTRQWVSVASSADAPNWSRRFTARLAAAIPGLYFNQFGYELEPAQSGFILFRRRLFRRWHQTGRDGLWRANLDFDRFRQ